MHVIRTVLVLIFLGTLAAPVRAELLIVRIPGYSDGIHEYYAELLERALTADGHMAIIEKAMDIPHLRERDMLRAGNLSVIWLVQTDERDRQFIPVRVNLTNGLVGKRILLVPPGQENIYKEVKTLDDFRRLGKVGGFGRQWYDVDVWKANRLPYKEVSNWRLLYKMIASGSRGVDYFSRGFNEVLDEIAVHPDLVIEPNLLLAYDRDFVFYVSPLYPDLARKIEKALIKKHWEKNFEVLKPEQRTVIRLNSPK